MKYTQWKQHKLLHKLVTCTQCNIIYLLILICKLTQQIATASTKKILVNEKPTWTHKKLADNFLLLENTSDFITWKRTPKKITLLNSWQTRPAKKYSPAKTTCLLDSGLGIQKFDGKATAN